MESISLAAKLATFTEHWSPRIVARMNDLEVMVVKLQGDFVWHRHDDTDDLFLVLQGAMTIAIRDEDGNVRDIAVQAGEMFVVPRGMEHCPRSDEECHVLIMERAGTPNTGDEATAAVKVVV